MFSVARHQRLSHSQRNEHILPRKIPSYGFLYSCCPVRSHLLIGHNETLAQSLLQFVLCMRQRLQMDCAIVGEKSVMGWEMTYFGKEHLCFIYDMKLVLFHIMVDDGRALLVTVARFDADTLIFLFFALCSSAKVYINSYSCW